MRISALLLVIFVGCTSEPEPAQAPDSGTVAADSPRPAAVSPAADSGTTVPGSSPRVYEGAGRVRNITPSRSHFIIDHGDIRGFMGPMTMPFAPAAGSTFATVAVGDSVTFRLEVDGVTMHLKSLTRITSATE